MLFFADFLFVINKSLILDFGNFICLHKKCLLNYESIEKLSTTRNVIDASI